MSTNPIFKWENVHIIMYRKYPILIIQQGLGNIMWTHPMNLNMFSECEFDQRVYTGIQGAGFSAENLFIHTQCGP